MVNLMAKETKSSGSNASGKRGVFLTLKVRRRLGEIVNELATLRRETVADTLERYQRTFENDLLKELARRKAEIEQSPKVSGS